MNRNLQLLISLALIAAPGAQALSLFPEITETRVAATTNREVARGIATDGTNFLVVFQGDNLYPAPDQTNQLAAQWIGPTGSLIGSRIDLGVNGSVPLIEYGTSNFLMTWVGNTSGSFSIRGRFLDGMGAPFGASLVIASNTSAMEVGTMTFAADQFWIAWSQTNVTNNACIMLQRVSESGVSVGEPLALGATNSADQRFPALSRGRTNVLVTWVALRADTNAWDMLGRFVNTNGNAPAEIVVSQSPSRKPYPVTAASDGTNHLVVWSREAGLPRLIWEGDYTEPGHQYTILSTNQFPMIFGRLLNEIGFLGVERAISSSRWGQISPSSAFDGTNYLVAWNDRRYADYSPFTPLQGGYAWMYPPATNQTLFSCFIDRAGNRVDWEFISEALPPVNLDQPRPWDVYANGRPVPLQDFDGGTHIVNALLVRFARDSAAVLRNRRSETGETNDVLVMNLTSPRPSIAQIKLVGIISNYPFSTRHTQPFVHVQISSTNSHFIPQWSSNAVDWTTPKPDGPYFYDYEASDFIEIAGDWMRWNEFILRFFTGTRFFRAIEDKYDCKSGLRKIARLKEAWAAESNRSAGAVPVDTDLYTSAMDKPSCPSGGWTTYRHGSLNMLPHCFVPYHELP